MKWLAFVLCGSLPVHAQDARFPALFDVTGVAADDTLNIRQNPRATAGLLADLPPDATGIEVIRLSDSGGWGLVNIDERAGWTSMQFLERQAGQDWQTPPAITRCYGAEPFWGLDLHPDTLGFSTPVESLSIDLPQIDPVAGRREPWSVSVETEHGPLYAIVSRQSCSDGMSDIESGYRIDLIQVGQGSLTGCCTLMP